MIERLSSADMMPLTTEAGPVPSNIGAVLVLSGMTPTDIHALLADRVARIGRLRQRLLDPPVGGGRPVWVDDATFRIDRHVVTAPGTFTDDGLLRAGAELLTTHLPMDRPLWGAMWVPDVAGRRSALVMVVHHVLADGLGGIAMLGALSDEAAALSPTATPSGFPAAPPAVSELRRDARAARGHALRDALRPGKDRLAGLRELGVTTHRPRLAPRTSLNRPSGSRRRVTTTTVPLAELVRAAHGSDATVNDVVLAAVTGALSEVLGRRGEHPEGLVVSVPVSARSAAAAGELGNAVGTLPILVPSDPDPQRRLAAVRAETAAAKGSGELGSSVGVVTTMARALGALGLAQAFVDRQRLVNTFETNLRGPATALHLGGARIDGILPLVSTPGNACVTFGAMSYAGRLVVAVYADPDVLPPGEQDLLTQLVAAELARLTD